MQEFIAIAVEQWRAQSLWEVAAVLLAIAYLVLAIQQSLWCWPCAAGSTAIYVVLLVGAQLYMESLLYGFYFVMAVYGWFAWRSGERGSSLAVVIWSLRIHVKAIVVIVLLAVVSGALLTRYTDAAYPYVDSLTTFAALWATFLLARKVLENWWYWLIIDAISVAIYWQRDLQLTALLFVLYVVMVPMGYLAWRRTLYVSAAEATV